MDDTEHEGEEPFVPHEDAILRIRRLLVKRFEKTDNPIPRGEFNRSGIHNGLERARHGPFPPGAEPDAFVRTALLLRGLVGEHAFPDGNKRTGLMVAFVTLLLNGYSLEVSQDEAVETMRQIADQEIEVLALAKWLEQNCQRVRLSDDETVKDESE